jgi:phosphatidylserine/phosphatidylglycerophosphate/cardiolipin synthase-like enzyme
MSLEGMHGLAVRILSGARPQCALQHGSCLTLRSGFASTYGDTTRAYVPLRRFAERFLRHEWPGPRLPEVFYDPRNLVEGDALRASPHAKWVVADGERACIGSANFSEAAQLRNIEIGVVVHGATIARAIEEHCAALIQRADLRCLPLS